MVKIWAHRGASGQAPENTLAAFRRACQQGADGIELDVQLSADGELVVIHDESLERTTDGRGWVKDHSLAQLKRLDASCGLAGFAGEGIPTLRQALEFLAGTGLEINVELKDSVVPYPGLPDQASQLIDEFDLGDRVTLSSFNHCSLDWLRRNRATTRIGVLFTDVLYEPWDYAARLGAVALHPGVDHVDWSAELVDASHAAGLEVNVWTANRPADIARMIGRGVDRVITDYPDLAARLRQAGVASNL